MKFSDFIKDRIFAYIMFFSAGIIILLFAAAFSVPAELCIAAVMIAFMALALSELRDFFRKRDFYDDLLSSLDSLDKKYLIAETLSAPSFYEGALLCDVLHETDRSMCERVSEYERENRSYREFIELWVHEVKLPLSSMRLMIHNGEDAEKLSEQLRRLDGYADTVLYYARSMSAEKDYIINEVSLKRAVTETALRYRDDLILSGASLKTDVDDVKIMSDGKWIGYILSQLMSNSLKYFSEEREPEINITVRETADYVTLKFRDNGIGIAGAELPKIFDRSFTGENGRTHARSTGMGLYIVKSLCTKLGHKIEVSSKKGEFTEFKLTFAKNDYYKM